MPQAQQHASVAMKACSNQWVVAQLHPGSERAQLAYWNTASTTEAQPTTSTTPNSPGKSRSISSSICGVLFLWRDHSALFVIPHHHASTEAHAHANTVTYGEHRNVVYRIPLLTSVDKHGERVTFSQIMPQPRVSSHHAVE